MYKYVLIDWDGTLFRTLDLWHDSLKAVLAEHGYSLDERQIGANYPVFLERAKSLGVDDAEYIINQASQDFANKTQTVALYEGASELLEQLHRQMKVALVTTSTHAQVDEMLVNHNILQYFDVVVCADDVTKPKPDAEPLSLALDLLKGNKQEAVMLGDSENDIVAAQSFGIDSILLHTDAHKKFCSLEQMKAFRPTHVATSYRSVRELVLK